MRFRRTADRSIRSIEALRFSSIDGNAIIRQRIIIRRFLRDLRLLLVQRLAKGRRRNGLLGSRSFLLRREDGRIIGLMTAVVRLALNELRLTVLVTLMARGIASINRSCRRAETVLVAGSALCVRLNRYVLVGLA